MKNCKLCNNEYGSVECEAAHTPGQPTVVARVDNSRYDNELRDTPPTNGFKPVGVVIDEMYEEIKTKHEAKIRNPVVGKYLGMPIIKSEMQIGDMRLQFGDWCIMCHGKCKGHQL